MHSSNKI